MSGVNPRSKYYAAAVIAWLLPLSLTGAAVSNIQYLKLSQQVIETRLKKYAGDDQQREHTLKQMFADAGCDHQHLSEQPVKGSKVPNVICVLPGSSGKTIIVGAHFDHATDGDGVVENWSGAALLPSLYQSAAFASRAHTYIFVGFTDEEKGDFGSHYYVQHMSKEEVVATEAMVNLDTLGLGPTEVWTNHSDNGLLGQLLYVSHLLNIPIVGQDLQPASLSGGAEEFAARKIPRITIHTLSQETWDAHILHTAKDNLAAIQLDNYYDTYSLLACYIAFLDQGANINAIIEPPPASDISPDGPEPTVPTMGPTNGPHHH
jgi:hypothetical protein